MMTMNRPATTTNTTYDAPPPSPAAPLANVMTTMTNRPSRYHHQLEHHIRRIDTTLLANVDMLQPHHLTQ